MKEVWEKQYDKKEPPWNYDKFDKTYQNFLELDILVLENFQL